LSIEQTTLAASECDSGDSGDRGGAVPSPARLLLQRAVRLGARAAVLQRPAIPGVEQVADGVYRRVVELNGDAGRLTVSKHPRRHCLIATVDGAAARHVDGAFARRVARCSTSLPIRPRSAAGSRAIRGSRRSSTPRRGCACRAHGRDSSWRCVRSSVSR
jgi:hypothetical protein